MRRFRALFGTTPAVCEIVWARLAADGAHPVGAQPVHLLYALLLLKTYGTEESNHSITGKDEKTFKKWAWLYIELVAFRLHVISFADRHCEARLGQTCFVSLDGTDCPIQEPIPFSRDWYSHKLKGAGLRYEIGLSINSGIIVWACGGVPCGPWPDITLARHHYTSMVNPGEKTITDKGYNDITYFINPNSNPDSVYLQKKIMARHETLSGRLKQFKVLDTPFRHDRSLHPMCFHAVVNFTQLMLEHGASVHS